MVGAIDQFFLTGILPVEQEATIDIYAFMEAARERKGGIPIKISGTIDRIKI
ncbi:MAG: hypothetical protein WDZ72_04445 [Cyclobacteriaceae bacterium]